MSQKAKDLYMAALKAQQSGKFNQALKLYKAAAREDTEFREAFVNLGALYSRAKRPDLALGFFRRALELRADAAVYFNLGSECYKLERYPECEKYLKAALKLEVRLLRAHILLGYLYEKQKRFDKSAIYFQNALRIDPTTRAAVLGLAVSLSDQEKFEEALAVVEKYRGHAPGDAFVNDLRAGLLLKLNRYEESLDQYREVIRTDVKYKDFNEHLTKAREANAEEYEALFDGIDDKIQERTQRLRKKIEQRKARMAAKKQAAQGGAPEGDAKAGEQPQDADADLKADLKDMVDLSFLHLFNGDTDKALRFLMQARKMKQKK
ncbi:MAG: tetratricopeptide repeat protein [bacterium]|nr:tetratricopeptide repeat protein [bacterium]